MVSPSGAKLWRWKFRFGGKEKRLALGKFPAVGLKDARKRRDEARDLLDSGIDPSVQRREARVAQLDRVATTFELVAREWHTKQEPGWAKGHSDRVLSRLERHVFPWIGSRPISDISAPDILPVLQRLEKKGRIETAHRALGDAGKVFRYAIATARAERDPTPDLRGALPPVRAAHFPAATEPVAFGDVLRKIDLYEERSEAVSSALKLAPLLCVRPGELRQAEWKDLDLEGAEWRYTAGKTGTQHIVPLSRQAVRILRDIEPLTGAGRYVFPNHYDSEKPMSDATLTRSLRLANVPADVQSVHGFRACFRTLADEVLAARVDLIEHQLGHAVRDANGRAYNRTHHLPERRKLMQQWADYCDQLKRGGDVIHINRVAAPVSQ